MESQLQNPEFRNNAENFPPGTVTGLQIRVIKNQFSLFSTKRHVKGKKRTVILRPFFEHTQHMLKLMGEKILIAI